MLNVLINKVKQFAEPHRVPDCERYLKIFEGGYGFGDVVWGVRNPVLRSLAKEYKNLPITDVFQLLSNQVHELRLLSLFIFELKYAAKITSDSEKDIITHEYLNHLEYVNNWDLVDASAHKLLGPWVFKNNKPETLIKLAKSTNLWENRVAVIATFYHIRKLSFDLPLDISTILLSHKHDIIHKAVGWMLREIGNRDFITELAFLKEHSSKMPRTMLRYAIEKFDEQLRQAILAGQF